MSIKSLDELNKIREKSRNKIQSRISDKIIGDNIEVLIGMATCGISTGAKETHKAIIEEIKKEKIENIKVIPVGCIGFCYSEPVVQVNIPGNKPIIYSRVDAKKGKQIVKQHIKNHKLLFNDSVFNININRA